MTVLAFSMTGTPRGKGRPRTAVRGGFATIYTDAKTKAYEASIAKIGKAAMGGRPPFTGPLSLSVRFRFTPAKSLPKRERAALLSGEQAYMGTIDIDNMLKALMDGLNGVCFVDDRQVTRCWAIKEAAEVAGVDVRIEARSPQQEAA
jgi:Holliday junction resolvase RusA-like endonuclease